LIYRYSPIDAKLNVVEISDPSELSRSQHIRETSRALSPLQGQGVRRSSRSEAGRFEAEYPEGEQARWLDTMGSCIAAPHSTKVESELKTPKAKLEP